MCIRDSVYTVNFAFEWFIISTQGIADYDPNPQGFDFDYRAYQTWLNYETGEIRFLYDKVRTDAAAAEISLIDDYLFATAGNVTVSNNDVSGATSGMGYKFTPAPPQPTRIYDVDVDPLIESVVFLQTGYSGNFAPMTVTYPDGSAVNCNDTANVRCLTVNNKPGDRMVQDVYKRQGVSLLLSPASADGPRRLADGVAQRTVGRGDDGPILGPRHDDDPTAAQRGQ